MHYYCCVLVVLIQKIAPELAAHGTTDTLNAYVHLCLCLELIKTIYNSIIAKNVNWPDLCRARVCTYLFVPRMHS